MRSNQARGSRSSLVQALLALPLLWFAVWIIVDYPLAKLWLALLLVALAVAQWLRPTAWLIALPMLLPVLELAPWSGRLLFDEFDSALAVLATTALLRGQYLGGLSQLMRRSYLPLWLLGLATVIALYRGFMPPVPLDANAWSGYLTPWNALRVGQGFLWAMLFMPLLLVQLAAERSRVERDFTVGVVAGSVVFGTAVLWERGFFMDLMTARNLWDLFDSWLDLSSRYRITGLFSQMHFGGEAVDGFIVLVWPFALVLLLRERQPALIALGALALMLSAYACLVTFTRTTYLAVGVGALVASIPVLHAAGRRGLPGALGAMLFALGMAAANLMAFRYGGVTVLLASSAVLLIAALLGFFGGHYRAALHLVAMALLLLLGLMLALDGILTSKYRETGLLTALLVAVPLVSFAGLGAWLLGRWTRQRVSPRIVAAGAFALALVLPMIALGLGNTRMEVRMNSVAEDFKGRLQHWQGVVDLASHALPSSLFGQGMGLYPAAYLAGPRGAAEGAYAWHGDKLRLTASQHLRLGQRLPDWRPDRYRAIIRYRVLAGDPNLKLQLARRPLLVQDWFGMQANASLKPTTADADADGWRQAELSLDSRSFARPHWYAPVFTLFSIGASGRQGDVVEVDWVRLLDGSGQDLLRNGDFSAGGDRWLAYNDYDHLAWHAKNLLLIIWFDQGLLGVAAFVLFLLPVLSRLYRRALRGDHFALALLAALSGFVVLGSTSTLFDVPRLTLLFWLMAGMGLYRHRHRHRLGTRSVSVAHDAVGSG